MKKKMLIGIGLIGLALAATISGTLAWFTDKEETSNQLQTGFIDISLSLPNYDETKYQNIQPGDKIAMNPVIHVNDNSEDAFIRLKITEGLVSLANQQSQYISLSDVNAKVMANWTLAEDGYYYYKDKVSDGNDISFLQNNNGTTMIIPTSWDNQYASANITFTFTVEAIQANNNEGNIDTNGIWSTEISGTNILKYDLTSILG